MDAVNGIYMPIFLGSDEKNHQGVSLCCGGMDRRFAQISLQARRLARVGSRPVYQ